MPSKYKPEYCERLEAHMSKGLSMESFAGTIGVCRDTLYEWMNAHKAFKEAKKRGESQSLLWWEQQGIDGLYNVTTRDAEGGSSTVSMNAAVWCFNMKNRFGWKDKQEVVAEVETKNSTVSAQVAELAAWLKRLKTLE